MCYCFVVLYNSNELCRFQHTQCIQFKFLYINDNIIINIITQLKVVVLVNHDQIYEALYDVLNQRFISRTSPTTGKTVKMLRLAIGARSQLCPVAEGFRVIVIAEQEHAYNNLDLPCT